jgi:hypothetical protein
VSALFGEREQGIELRRRERARIAVHQHGVASPELQRVELQALARFHALAVRAQRQLQRVQRVVRGLAARRQVDAALHALEGRHPPGDQRGHR